MNINLNHAIAHIIGQTPSGTLAAFRAPHFLPEALFQRHTLLILLLMIAGLGLFYYARQRQQNRALLVIRAYLAIMLCWLFLNVLFVTPAQRLHAAHRHILNSAQAKDIPAVMNILADDFHWGPLTKNALPAMLRTTLDSITIKTYYLDNYRSDIEDRQALTQGHVTIYTDSGQVLTAWHLRWQDDPASDWKLVAVDKWALGDHEMPPGLPPIDR